LRATKVLFRISLALYTTPYVPTRQLLCWILTVSNTCTKQLTLSDLLHLGVVLQRHGGHSPVFKVGSSYPTGTRERLLLDTMAGVRVCTPRLWDSISPTVLVVERTRMVVW
jgi:hypothetical protein